MLMVIWGQIYRCVKRHILKSEFGKLLGGGAKDDVPSRTLRAQNQTRFRQGSRARLRALEALGLF